MLRWKRGERWGLRQVRPATKARVRPLFVVGPGQFRGRQPTASRPAVSAGQTIAQEVANDWGSIPFFMDASSLPPQAVAPHPLIDIAAHCVQLGLQLIPATHLAATPQYQQAVITVAQQQRRGAAIRVDLQGMTSAGTWAPRWPLPLAETDLIVDFGDNVNTVAALGTSLDHAFSSLHGAGQWRTVTVVGTSMPENFSGFIAGLHTIARVELALWQRLSAIGLSYGLDYGDYATVPVIPPPSGIAWGYPINVRYTLPTDFLICRGVGTTGIGAVDMDQQLIGHAQSIVAYAARSPMACWADARVDAIAAGAETPSNLEHWVRIGVNRHLELTRLNLP